MAKSSSSKTIATIDEMSNPSVIYIALGAIGSALSGAIIAILMVTGASQPSLFTLLCFAAGTLSLPIAGGLLFGLSNRKIRSLAAKKVTESIAGLADQTSMPTKSQMRELIKKQATIPFTVNGVSGAQVTGKVERKKTTYQHDEFTDKVVTISVATEVPDNGVESFQRLLQRAIDGNKDIKVAADASVDA